MEIDYYAVLNVRRDALYEEIALAYRKLAAQYHPKRDQYQNIPYNPPEGINEVSHLPALSSCEMWQYVNKAYDILSNPLRRQVYDTYGEAGLQRGVALVDGYFQPYIYHGNCMQTYNEVFGSNSPYANITDAMASAPPLFQIPGVTEGMTNLKIQDKPVEKLLYLDLKEIYTGVTRRMKILRHEFIDNEGIKTQIREKTLIVPIAPGTLPGTKIAFKHQGDRGVSRIPADIVFITADKPHPIFTRNASDLHIKLKIDLKQALCGYKFSVTTIDDKILNLSILDVIHPNYVKKLKGEGLPKLKEENKKGNLYIHFEVKFPLSIPRELKPKIAEVFDELNLLEPKKTLQNKIGLFYLFSFLIITFIITLNIILFK